MKASGSHKKFDFLKIDKLQLLDILKLFLNIKYTENYNFTNETQHFLKSLNYPSIDKQQYKDITINLEKFNFPHDILTPISSIFKFDIMLLQEYEKSANSHHNIISLIFIISFLCLKNFSFDTDILSILSNLINQFSSISDDQKAFFLNETFSHYIQITDSPIDIDFFLQIVSSLNPKFLPLFIAEYLTTKDESTKQFTLSFISSVKNDDYFIQNISTLIQALLPSIEKLDRFGLEFFAFLVNFKDVKSIIEIIQRFPEIIRSNIKSQISFPPVFSFCFPKDGYLEYVFNFDSTETMPNGLLPLPLNLINDGVNIDKKVKKDLVDISSAISSFLMKLHIEFAILFLNSLATSVSEWKDDALYLAFVLIVTKINFSISKTIANALFHPVVFSSGVSPFNKLGNDQIQIQSNNHIQSQTNDQIQSNDQIQENDKIQSQINDKIQTQSNDKIQANDQNQIQSNELIQNNETKNQQQQMETVKSENQIENSVQTENQSIIDEMKVDYDLILSIRKSIINAFILNQKEMIQSVLMRFHDSPFLFAETIARIHDKLPKCDLPEIINDETISLIMSQLSLLWYFCVRKDLNVYDSNNEKNTKVEQNEADFHENKSNDLLKYRSARSTIFQFIFSVLDDDQLCIQCFSSSNFTNGFLPRVLESSLQKLILNSLSKFLVLCNDKVSMRPTFQIISSIFKVCQSNKEKLVYDLLNIINEASILNHSDILFDPIITSVTSYLNRYPSSAFLTSTLRLFTQISQNSDTFSLNHLQIKQLSSAVRQIEDECHHDETISALLGLIGLSHSVTTSSMFLIKKPSLITLTFSILRSKEKLEEVLTFFSNLCKHSVFNVFQCHRGELDFLIIEMMKNVSKPFVFRGCEFDGLSDIELMKNVGLPLIMNIVTVVCNNAVTTKLIRLISLNNDLSVDILNSINSSFSSLAKLSTPIVPINNMEEPAICVKNINGSLINQNFTILASLFVDNPYSLFLNRKYYLFQLSDESSLTINFILNGESIICRVSTESDIYTCSLFKDFPKCQWTTIIIFFSRNLDGTCKFSLLTKEYYSNNFIINCPDFKNSKMSLKIGFTESVDEDDLSEYQGFPFFIGRVSLYPIEFTKEMSFSAIVTETQITDPLPLFSYPQTGNSCQYPVTENIKYKVKNILDVFTESQIFEFLPLFSPLDQMSDILLRVLLSIISTVLSYSVSLQSKFSFFPVISNLLLESNPKRLTYSLYMKFFSIIGNCSDSHIISEIIKHILLNFELWIRAEATQLIRIAQHWGSSLYSACDQILNESISFDTLISMIRMYFWFTPVETNIIRGVNERSPNLDINLCWQHIDRLLTNSIKSRGSSTEIINTILSHCASCKDIKQIIHYFSILRANCADRSSQFNNEFLFIFTKLKDEESFIETLKTFYDFSNTNFISFNIYSLLNVVQDLEDNNFYSAEPSLDKNSLIDKLIEILPEYPLIYPLIILFSFYCGKDAMLSTSKSLGKFITKSSFKDIIKDDFWMSYLLILAIKLDKPDNLNIIFFICSIIVENYSTGLLMNVLDMIDFFDSNSSLHFNEIRDEILKAVTDLNLTNSSKIKNELFIIGAKNLLLHYEKCSPLLQEVYNSSPFYELNQISKANNNINIEISPSFDSIDMKIEEEQNSGSHLVPSNLTESSSHLTNNDGIQNQSNSNVIPHARSSRRRKFERNSLIIITKKDNFDMKKGQSNHENSENQIENVKSPKDLAKLFSIDPNKIKRFHFGIHFSNDENYLLLLSNVCQLFTLTNNGGDSNDSFPPHILKYISFYLNCISNNTKKNFQNLEEPLHLFFSNASLIWSMRVKNFVKRGKDFFSSVKLNSLFPVSKVGFAFRGITYYTNFLSNSSTYSNKMRLELERRFGDIIKLKEKRYYKHRFRFSSNFTQPKVSQFAKNSILHSKESKKKNRSHSLIGNSTVLFQCGCTVIKIINSTKTTFNLTKENIILERMKIIPISSISYILRRRVLQRKTAVEFITNEGTDFLIDFSPMKSKKIIKKIVNLVKFPDSCVIQRVGASKFFTKVVNFTEKWMKREMTNFDYLMLMNIFGGRSYRDPSNYPIFPWIISDYSDKSDSSFAVDDQSIYRDLFYPISAQDEERRNDLLQKFDIKKPISEENLIFFNAPSNPTIVSYWMIHEEPFTSLHLETEGGKFDLSARLFSSISSSAEQAKSNSSCWELIPEFYYMPEILLNLNNIGFKGNEENYNEESVSDENERIRRIFDHKDNVILPNWANKSPFELVYLLRKALESEFVSQNLNEWIDMIFGVASSGEDAKEHFNVFSPVLLSDIWKVNDYKNCSNDRKEFIETSLSKSGQIPKPLFKTKHPKRRPLFESSEFESNEKLKQNLEILSLSVRSEELNNERNLIKAATILFENSKRIKVIYIIGNGKIETFTISIFVKSSISVHSTPSDSITSSSTEIYNTNDYSSGENNTTTTNNNLPLEQSTENNNNSTNSSNTQEKIEYIVTKDANERFLRDVDHKSKFYSLENGIVVVNKDKLRFITANSITTNSNSSVSYDSISPLFESNLLVCDSRDSISIVNNEGVIYYSSLIQSIPSSSNSLLSSSFLSFLSASSPSMEESSSNEILSLASISNSKKNLFSKSGRKQIEYELEFKKIGRAHCEKPLVICSSKQFDILAVTSIEGNVNLYSLLNGIYECTCYTCDEPAERILITPGWGFIVVTTIQDVYLFNVNGFLIRKVPKLFNISSWCTWTDERGFDFVAVFKDDGSLVVCEAFYLNFSEPIQIIREPPVVMKYYPENKSILIVTKNKRFISVPLP